MILALVCLLMAVVESLTISSESKLSRNERELSDKFYSYMDSTLSNDPPDYTHVMKLFEQNDFGNKPIDLNSKDIQRDLQVLSQYLDEDSVMLIHNVLNMVEEYRRRGFYKDSGNSNYNTLLFAIAEALKSQGEEFQFGKIKECLSIWSRSIEPTWVERDDDFSL